MKLNMQSVQTEAWYPYAHLVHQRWQRDQSQETIFYDHLWISEPVNVHIYWGRLMFTYQSLKINWNFFMIILFHEMGPFLSMTIILVYPIHLNTTQ